MPDFQHPLVLWLLLPLAAGLIWRWLSPPAGVAVSSTTHFRPDAAGKRWTSRHFLLLLETLAAAGFIVALARPQQGVEIMPVTREGTDIILSLDYSNSMDAYDPPSSMSIRDIQDAIQTGDLVDRLGVARQQIARFVKRRSGDRIGLVIFGVDAFVACPPTLDHDFLVAQVDQLNNSLLDRHERGTNIAGGIATSINALQNETDTKRTIVLITDGDHTVKDEVFSPVEAAQAARDEGITIHTVGIGSDDPYRTGWLKSAGASIRFDTRNLERIASIANGRFFRAKDTQGFEDVMDTIDALETTSRVHPALVFQRDLYPYFLIPAAILLFLSFILRKTLLLELS
ncbi:MAG: VWA domain-containing protein [Verrucomicrobiaceae bacterium]